MASLLPKLYSPAARGDLVDPLVAHDPWAAAAALLAACDGTCDLTFSAALFFMPQDANHPIGCPMDPRDDLIEVQNNTIMLLTAELEFLKGLTCSSFAAGGVAGEVSQLRKEDNSLSHSLLAAVDAFLIKTLLENVKALVKCEVKAELNDLSSPIDLSEGNYISQFDATMTILQDSFNDKLAAALQFCSSCSSDLVKTSFGGFFDQLGPLAIGILKKCKSEIAKLDYRLAMLETPPGSYRTDTSSPGLVLGGAGCGRRFLYCFPVDVDH